MIKKNIKIVTWRDVISSTVWKTLDEAKEWAKDAYENDPCQTCGLILFERPDYIVIAASKDGGEEYGEIVMIPRSLIISIT